MGDHRDPSVGSEQSAKYHRGSHSGKGGRPTRSQLKPQWRGKERGGSSESPWKRHPRNTGRQDQGWVEGRSSHQRQGIPQRSSTPERQQEGKVPANTSPRPQLKEGKRKASQSLNHLLNFTIASSSGSPGWGGNLPLRSHKHRPLHHFSKEQFLQANCQFVVRTGTDYSLHLSDPDTLVDWEQVEQVRLFCNEMPSCPICLDQPRVAKITRCGHVFCWSCMLHYLALSDHSWRKCPICFESVHRESLKSVVALSSPVYRVEDTVVMRLMVRTKGGTAVLPKSQWTQESGRELLSVKSDKATRFVKLLTATAAEVLETITSGEKAALELQLSTLTAEEESERMFVEGALVQLQEREEQLMKSVELTEEVDWLIESVLSTHTSGVGAVGSVSSQSPRAVEEGAELRSVWDTETVLESSYQAAFSDSDHDDNDTGDAGSSSSGSSEERGSRNVEGCLAPPDSLQPSDEGGRRNVEGCLAPPDSLQPSDEGGSRNVEGCLAPPDSPQPSDEGGRRNVEGCLAPPDSLQPSDEGGRRNVEGCLAPPDSPQPSDEGGRRNVEGCLAPPDSLQPSDGGGSPSEHDLTEPTVATKKSTEDSCEKDASAPELVHFFQAADGQHLYLHPINARCLMKEYGKLEYAPQEIRAQIVELEQHSMTKEGRSRFRFLSHLPLTCQIVLCELNLKPPLLSTATLEEFADGLKWRKEKRAKKRREEHGRGHRQHTAHQPVESRSGHHEWIRASPVEDPPHMSQDLLSVDSSPPLPSLAPARTSDESASGESTQPQPHQLQDGGSQEASVTTPPMPSVSFAAALRCSNKAAPPPIWPGKESTKTKVLSPTAPREGERDEEGQEEGPMVPSFQDAFGDALSTTLEKLQTVPAANHVLVEGPGASRAGKRGRKKMVLFTTGNIRRGT